LVRHPHRPSGQESGPLLRMRMLEVGQSRTPVFGHIIYGTPNEDIQHAVQRSGPAMPNVRGVTRRTDRRRQTGGRARISAQPHLVLLRTRTRPERKHSWSQMRLHQSSHDPRRDHHNDTTVGATCHAHSRCRSHHVPRRLQGCGVLSTLRIRTSIDCGKYGHSSLSSWATAATLSITLMPLAPKCARIIGSKVGRLAMLTAVVTVASAAHEPPEYMPTQFDTRDPLLTPTPPHTFQATAMSHLQLPSMAETPQRFEQLKTTYTRRIAPSSTTHMRRLQ
jgi:hypothetical protein